LSQVYKSLVSGPVPPAVATSYVTDVNSPAIPAANILNVVGGSSSVDNINGIRTDGSTGSNTLTVQLTNRFQGTLTTTNATPTNISTFALGVVPGVYTFDVNVAGYDVTDSLGLGYSIFGTVRTDGATATICGIPDKIANPETGAGAADCNIVVSGNSVSIQATGIAAKTIRWNAVTTYVLVV
jgi:hypothetical protein